jgi:hypothetical protein
MRTIHRLGGGDRSLASTPLTATIKNLPVRNAQIVPGFAIGRLRVIAYNITHGLQSVLGIIIALASDITLTISKAALDESPAKYAIQFTIPFNC